MAWTTPLTAVSNAALTAAQWNASLRDNMLITPAGLATAAGQIWVSTAANAGAMRTPTYGHVTASETTTTTGSYGDLTTPGPTVTVVTGTSVIYAIGAFITNGTGGGGGQVGVATSGATTVAASDSGCLYYRTSTAGQNFRGSTVHFRPLLNAGSNTFTAKYTTPTGGTATFSERHLIVLPL